VVDFTHRHDDFAWNDALNRLTPNFLCVVVMTLAATNSKPALASLHGAGVPSDARVDEIVDSLPRPPVVEGLIGLEIPPAAGRSRYLSFVAREAERHGLSAAVVDAVVMVESAYDPTAIGNVGEIGLMQVRPSTAAMLGFTGTEEALAYPETNIRYGVEYLAQAWQLANGDLCRALMKYRAGHGTERMTLLSVEYCRRVRAHLMSVGATLGTDGTEAFAPDKPVQVALADKVSLPASRRVTVEEKRRAALQKDLVQRFILAVARVGSDGQAQSRAAARADGRGLERAQQVAASPR
jgi:hypothetical protein